MAPLILLVVLIALNRPWVLHVNSRVFMEQNIHLTVLSVSAVHVIKDLLVMRNVQDMEAVPTPHVIVIVAGKEVIVNL